MIQFGGMSHFQLIFSYPGPCCWVATNYRIRASQVFLLDSIYHQTIATKFTFTVHLKFTISNCNFTKVFNHKRQATPASGQNAFLFFRLAHLKSGSDENKAFRVVIKNVYTNLHWTSNSFVPNGVYFVWNYGQPQLSCDVNVRKIRKNFYWISESSEGDA